MLGSKPARTRGGRQPEPLGRDDVLRAALAVVARHGLPDLTVKAVADELGVTSPAVYHYVDGKAVLVERVCAEVAAEVRLDVDPSSAWDEQILAIVQGMHDTFARYPGVGERVLSFKGRAPAANAIAARIVDIARGAGFSSGEAVGLSNALQLVFAGWLLRQAPFVPDRLVADADHCEGVDDDPAGGLTTAARFVLVGFAASYGQTVSAAVGGGVVQRSSTLARRQ